MNNTLSYTVLCFFMFLISCKKDKTSEIQCTGTVSFSNDVQLIIMNSCAVSGCHAGANPANNMNFTSYENIYLHRILIGRSIRHESGVDPMPVGPQLNADQISKISCWIEQGAPNN